MKTCSKCGETKPLEDFHKKASAKDGRVSRCKVCQKGISRAYYEKNRERVLTNMKVYADHHKDSLREYNKQYRLQKADQLSERNRQYYQANRETIRRKQNVYNREYQKKFPEKVNARWHKRRALLESASVDLIVEKDWRRLNASCCNFCGSDEDIHVDHIVPLAKGGSHSIGNLQPLCASCNTSKGSKFYADWRYRHAN